MEFSELLDEGVIMDKTKELFLKFLNDMDFEIKTGNAYKELRDMGFGSKLIEYLEDKAALAKLIALKLYGFKESELKRDNSLFLKWVPKTGNYDNDKDLIKGYTINAFKDIK
tara:strand:- start:18 stop:353 length:336 start_codon:yes stop_codon:yes gene_type:complete